METLSVNSLIKDSPAPVAILDMQMKFICYSDIWLRQVAEQQHSLIGKSYYDVLPNTPEALKSFYSECLQKQCGHSIVQEHLLSDGTLQEHKWKVNIWKNEQQQVGGLIIVLEDITEEKRNQNKLQELLNRATEQNKGLLNFAHIVSHNLRSHSNNLSMLSGFLCDEYQDVEKQDLLKMLKDATESLNETVVHLNEIVQVKTTNLDQMTAVNLLTTIEGVQKNLSVLLREKKVVCHINVPKTAHVTGIPAYLDSIFLNLFTNSIRYSSPERLPIITINTREQDEKVVVSFSDNGLGIDLELHGKKLFGMYKTFHDNKEAKGIGLFITKNQIEAMNGRIEVHSTVNIGTTFTIHFTKSKRP